jgi:signal transduction histidine kinase
MRTTPPRPAAYRRGMSWRPAWFDLVLTAVLLSFGVLGAAPAAVNQHQTVPAVAYVFIALACLPILVWRRWPLWTFAVGAGSTLAYLGLGFPYGPIMIALAVLTLGTAIRLPVRHTLVAVAAFLLADVAVIGLVDVLGGIRQPTEMATTAVWVVVPAAVGVAIRTRRDAAAEVRAAQARRAVSEERLRLAQEVHDVAGHGFAVIAMQAGVALRVLDRDPAGARAALEGIRTMSREAVDGLRAEVDSLQRGTAPLRPSAGLADLPALVARIRASGLPVELSVEVVEAPSDVDLAAYRIVQEALTNVLRHAGPSAAARVSVRRSPDGLAVEVVNTGAVASVLAEGRGIGGMRDRAEGLGGSLDAGPDPEGFRVRADLPLPGGTA